ncbi:MAG: response regulator transcription factor [Sphingobacteriaceae bacterium]|nr:response regulator transcription factor [Cytophagaceae bacterium]
MPRPNLIDILLIDDHRIFSDGLKLLFNEQPDFRVCGQVFRANDVFPAIQRLQPHLILLDINLQGSNGIDLGREIVRTYPLVSVIVLTLYNQSKLREEARRAGLHGYLLKESSMPELLEGIRAVLGGSVHFDRPVTETPAADDSFGDEFAQRLNLTFREVEVIRLVREGLNNEQIAERLGVSFFTIKTHRKNIHFKLGISNVAELIQFAAKHGI